VPIRLVAILVAVALAAILAGCGDSSSPDQSTGSKAPAGASATSCDTHATEVESLRATEISCDQARQVMYGWQREPTCAVPAGASRGSCLTRSYRCQAVRAGRGLAVSCAREGQSIAFLAKP
jgi:hypothetical protein